MGREKKIVREPEEVVIKKALYGGKIVKIKDVCCGLQHSIVLTTDHEVYV